MGRATTRRHLLTPCIGCGRLVKAGTGGRCYACQNPARRYRSHRRWTELSRKLRAGAVCARCGSSGPLQVHHATARLADDLERAAMGQLVPLCAACHKATHAKPNTS